MTDITETRTVADAVADNKWLFWTLGGVSIVAGVLAIMTPHLASITAELLFGALLTVSGLFSGVAAFRGERSVAHIAAALFLSVIAVVTGVLLLLYPIEGALALTTFLAVFFVAGGAVKMYYGFRARPEGGWGWLVAGGVASLVLGGLILFALPGAAFWVLGLLLGIDLIFYGAGMFALVSYARDAASDE